MSKITLEVKDENVKKVLNLLENLKDGLILDLHVDKKISTYTPTYQPKANKVIKENEPVTGKYIDPAGYKKRLNKNK